MAAAAERNPSENEENSSQPQNSSKNLPPWAQNVIDHTLKIETKLAEYQQFSSQVAIVDNAVGILSTLHTDHVQKMDNFVEFQKANATILPNKCLMKSCGVPVDKIPDVTRNMTKESAENLRNDMLKGLHELKTQMANNHIYTGVVVSAGLIVLQICKLIDVWQEIKSAKNLHNDPMIFAAIEQKIEEFKNMCVRLNELITNEQVDDILLETMELNEKYTETILLIKGLEFKIAGVMQRLELAGTGQLHDAVLNGLMATSNIIQLFALFSSATTPGKIVAGTIIAAFGFLLSVNIGTHIVTEKRLAELRTDIQKLKQLELQAQRIHAEIKLVLRDHRRCRA